MWFITFPTFLVLAAKTIWAFSEKNCDKLTLLISCAYFYSLSMDSITCFCSREEYVSKRDFHMVPSITEHCTLSAMTDIVNNTIAMPAVTIISVLHCPQTKGNTLLRWNKSRRWFTEVQSIICKGETSKTVTQFHPKACGAAELQILIAIVEDLPLSLAPN